MIARNRIINALWRVTTRRDAASFARALGAVRSAQEGALLAIVTRNRHSDFGNEHGFSSIRSVDDFRARVPLRTYEELRPWIDRAAAGERRVLTTEPVLLFEPTGGTHGGTKLIPYTRSLRAEVRRAIAPWIRDLFERFPRLRAGRGYWSVSPAGRHDPRTPGGIPVGFDDDSGYLGRVGSIIVRTLVVPPAIRRVPDIDDFFYATALCLLRAADLSIVSVWNPTMLLLLTDCIGRHREALVRDVRDGTASLPAREAAVVRSLRRRGDRGRAAMLERALALPDDERYAAVWPRLDVVSCWADGAARAHLPRVASLFPRSHIQPKGLVATEGVVTIPLGPDDAHVPAIHSHFFEFESADGAGVFGVGELEAAGEYSVAVTTGGGLYRYRLRDRVTVTGRWQGLPVLRFLGREATCDLVGEKLDEIHVRRAIERAFAEESLEPGFVMMAPEPSGRGGHYELFIELDRDGGIAERIRRRVERELRRNFHYDYARELGQLGALRVHRVGSNAAAAYVERCIADGQRLGDVKPVYLDRRCGWAAALGGRVDPQGVTP